MVVGVNGTGKTTTIGKLASVLQGALGLDGDRRRRRHLPRRGDRAARDLGRARRAPRSSRGNPGGDPGAVVFDAIAAAEARGADVVIVDTAGRLHTHGNLMEELAKVRRVAAKRLEGAPHETLIVIDATTGQNGLRQAQAFADAVDVTGVVLTKLDGTAKGGIALAIAGELGIPVKLIGVGEGIEDLRPFDAREFAAALLGASSLERLDVRPALRPPAGDALRRPLARQADRGRRRQGDARDPPRAARGRRQLQGRQAVHRAGQGALPRRRGARRRSIPASRW